MGLQNQLTDMSSESFPILMVTLLANCVCSLRSFFITVFQSFGVSFTRFHNRNTSYQIDTAFCDAVGSGLAGVILLAEQLNLNRVFSYEFEGEKGCEDGSNDGGLSGGFKCVFCLNRLCEGDRVRKLSCRHVFHKDCFDGWLDQHHFDCPLCRTPLVADERVDFTRRQVAGDIFAWFSLR